MIIDYTVGLIIESESDDDDVDYRRYFTGDECYDNLYTLVKQLSTNDDAIELALYNVMHAVRQRASGDKQ